MGGVVLYRWVDGRSVCGVVCAQSEQAGAETRGPSLMWREHRRLFVLAGLAVVLAAGLVWVYGRSQEDSLLRQLDHGSTEERVQAIHGLEKIGSDRAAEAIAGYADHSDARLASHAVSALGKMGRPEHLRYVKQAAHHRDEDVREAAAGAMGGFGDKADVPVLIQSLDDPSQGRRVRVAAATSLGKVNDYSAMPTLIKAMADRDPLVRGRAYAAVRRIIQMDIGFRANDPPQKRQAMIARLRKLYPSLQARHDDYVRRMKERGK